MVTRAQAVEALLFDLTVTTQSGQSYPIPNPINGDSDTATPYVFEYQYAGTSQPSDLNNQYSGWTAFTAAEKVRFAQMLDHIESIVNVDFREVTGQADPTMNVGKVTLPGSTIGTGGYSLSASIASGATTATIADYDNFVVYDNTLDVSSGQDNLLIHEVLHALAGKHPFEGNPQLPAPFESNKYSVLSYTNNPDNGLEGDRMQVFDIVAMQERWGANLNTATGNDTYTGKRNTTVDAIWDAGGIDTFDASAKTAAVTLSLVEASFSTFDTINDVVIAYDVVIENAIGGAGSDTITGNAAANMLTGGAGEDTISGGTGSDTISGGDGADMLRFDASVAGDMDTFQGGGQMDTVDFSGFASAIWVDLQTGGPRIWTQDDTSVVNAAGTWRAAGQIIEVENIIGTNAIDLLRGDAADNSFAYRGTSAITGVEIIDGRAGTDTVDFSGFASAVWVDLQAAATAWTQDDTDAVNTAGTWRQIANVSGVENIIGTNAIDLMRGDAGDNTFGYRGNANNLGVESITGRGGSDTVDFSAFTSAVWVDLQTGSTAWTQDDTDAVNAAGTWRQIASISTVENIIGTDAIDLMRGDAGDNTFSYRGTAAITGVESITGRGGSDTLDFSGFASAVWVDLQTGSTAWTQDDTDAVNAAGTWRQIASASDVENTTGTALADELRGDAGDNTLTGGAGNDLLLGRGGNDTFVFADGHGQDTISDFASSDSEKIDLSGLSAITSFADLTASHLRADATTGFAEIFAGSDEIVLTGYTTANVGTGLAIAEGDFIF